MSFLTAVFSLFTILILFLTRGGHDGYLFLIMAAFLWSCLISLGLLLALGMPFPLSLAKIKESGFSYLSLLPLLFFPLFLYHQHSYAPTVSNIFFYPALIPVSVALILFLKGLYERKRVILLWSQLISAFLVLAGAVAVLSNLERPSSFYPLSRFFAWEVSPLISCLVMSFYILLYQKKRTEDKMAVFKTLPPMLFSGFIVSFIFALVKGSKVSISSLLSISAVFAGLLMVVFFYALLSFLAQSAPFQSSLIFGVLPFLLPIASFLERLKPTFRPSPLVVLPLLGGYFLFISSLILLKKGVSSNASLRWGCFILSIILLALGTLTAASPFMEYRIFAQLEGGGAYRHSWVANGYEFLAAFLLVIGGGLLFLPAFGGRKDLLHTLVLFPVLLSTLFLSGKTRLFNWFSFLPSEVSNAFGTEYVVLSEKLINEFYLKIAAILMVVAWLTLIVYLLVEFFKGRKEAVADDR